MKLNNHLQSLKSFLNLEMQSYIHQCHKLLTLHRYLLHHFHLSIQALLKKRKQLREVDTIETLHHQNCLDVTLKRVEIKGILPPKHQRRRIQLLKTRKLQTRGTWFEIVIR
uniref:Uncharacterized protein n=1 Tax=Pararge aegeria TaxID=116150 RepID=S4P3L9_9NEOP